MADLVFYGNISASTLNASNNELVSKGQSDTNSCSYNLSGISSWSAGALSNAFGQLRIYNGLVYICNQPSLTAAQGATAPDQSQYWDACTFSKSATATSAGLVKVGGGLSVSNGKISALASRRKQKTITNGTISLADGYSVYKISPSSSTSFSFAASDVSDCMQAFDLVVTFGATAYSLTFPTSVTWGFRPSEYLANKTYLFRFSTFDSGETWYGACLNGPQGDPNANSIIFTVTVAANTELWVGYCESYISPVTADWGDGTTETLATDDIMHTYTSAGTYQVKLKSPDGKMPMLMFMGYTELDSIDYADVEWYGEGYAGYEDAEGMFDGCTNLTSIPGTLFSKNSDFAVFKECFKNCSSLESVPEGLFGGSVASITDLTSCFEGCSSLTSIPSGLFSGCASVTAITNCFKGCTGLTSIPSGLFSGVGSVTSFAACFQGCSSLASIPSGLFSGKTSVTSFAGCFFGCSSLTTVPSGLFAGNTSATTFDSCFSGCSSLSSASTISFPSSATSFISCFYGCTGLTTVPTTIFDNITSANFANCFMGCSSLVPSSSQPYIPQVWEKDNGATLYMQYNSYRDASTAARGYAPTTWGGTIPRYSAATTYSQGDWVWEVINDVPKVYTYINEASGSGHNISDTSYWAAGYEVISSSSVNASITFKGYPAVGVCDIAFEGISISDTSGGPTQWTYGTFNTQTSNGSLSPNSGSGNYMLFYGCSYSLSGGVCTITFNGPMVGTSGSQYGISSGDTLVFTNFTETSGSPITATSNTATLS